MLKDNSVIVKEITYAVKGVDFTLRGRVRLSHSGGREKLFVGSLSHYCKPSEVAATAYRPSLTGKSLNEVMRQMKTYASTFKPIGVISNENF